MLRPSAAVSLTLPPLSAAVTPVRVDWALTKPMTSASVATVPVMLTPLITRSPVASVPAPIAAPAVIVVAFALAVTPGMLAELMAFAIERPEYVPLTNDTPSLALAPTATPLITSAPATSAPVAPVAALPIVAP